MLRLLLPAVLVLGLLSAATESQAKRYFVGGRGELATLTGGVSPHFYPRFTYGFEGGFDLNARWTLDASLSFYRLFTDSLIENSFSFEGDQANAEREFRATRVGALLSTSLYTPAPWFQIRGGLGGGLLIWELVDPESDTTLETIGSRNETIDFASTEIFLSAGLGTEFQLSPRFSLALAAHADYLTGAGTDFAESISSDRDRWLIGSTAALHVWFGSRGDGWISDESWPSTATATPSMAGQTDSDGDGVPDATDRCLETAAGVLVDSVGCALDSDGDGIEDGRDHCPDTDARARGLVDIYGCPIDADFDGVADYRDDCRNSRQGAAVDEKGCPVDDDADGVPNGLDDCPNTLYGVPVDKYGCLDLSIFDEAMVLNIDYPPGSYEIDFGSQERLRSLARVLMVAPQVRIEVNGYTDNIGTEEANQALSQKRANRVRDFLVAQGIDEDRIRVFGRGESNFVATNDTAEGRGMNRRIEIVFYK